MGKKIPDSHRDLLAGPVNVVLTTIMPDGQPQTTPVWCNLDGGDVLINTMKQFRKAKNMAANPKVTLLAYKLKEPLRNIEVRGRVVEMSEEGAIAHADKQTQAYSNNTKQRFYGDIYPAEQRTKETRVIVKVLSKKVTTDAIFS